MCYFGNELNRENCEKLLKILTNGSGGDVFFLSLPTTQHMTDEGELITKYILKSHKYEDENTCS